MRRLSSLQHGQEGPAGPSVSPVKRLLLFAGFVVRPLHLWLPVALWCALAAVLWGDVVRAMLLWSLYAVCYLYVLLDHRRSELLSFNLLPFLASFGIAWAASDALMRPDWTALLHFHVSPGGSVCSAEHLMGVVACLVGFPAQLHSPRFLLTLFVCFWSLLVPVSFWALVVWPRKSLQSWGLLSLLAACMAALAVLFLAALHLAALLQ